MEGKPTHVVKYPMKHIKVYLGINNMPLARKDQNKELLYGAEHVVYIEIKKHCTFTN